MNLRSSSHVLQYLNHDHVIFNSGEKSGDIYWSAEDFEIKEQRISQRIIKELVLIWSKTKFWKEPFKSSKIPKFG